MLKHKIKVEFKEEDKDSQAHLLKKKIKPEFKNEDEDSQAHLLRKKTKPEYKNEDEDSQAHLLRKKIMSECKQKNEDSPAHSRIDTRVSSTQRVKLSNSTYKSIEKEPIDEISIKRGNTENKINFLEVKDEEDEEPK